MGNGAQGTGMEQKETEALRLQIDNGSPRL